MTSEITGVVEVILEDKNGKRKHYEKAYNNLTNAALFNLLSGGLASTPFLTQVLRTDKEAGTGQQSRINNAGIRVYCLSKDIHVSGKTILRPYMNASQTGLNRRNDGDFSIVSFLFDKIGDDYEVNPQMSQNAGQELTPFLKNCAFLQDGKILRYSFEYRNIDGTGQVNSVILGQNAEDTKAMPIGIRLTPRITNLPDGDFVDGSYCIQHYNNNGAPATAIWKSTDNAQRLGIYNPTLASYTTDFDSITNFITAGPDPEVTMSGGLLVRTNTDDLNTQYVLAKAYIKGMTDETSENDIEALEGNELDKLTVCLALIQDCTAAANPIIIEHEYTPPTGYTLGLRTSPVLVQEPDGSLSIFFSGEQCKNEEQQLVDAYALYKWTIPALSLASGTDAASIGWGQPVKVGEIPYCVGSCFPSTSDNQYLLGYYDPNNNEYYLPVSAFIRRGLLREFGPNDTVLGIRIRPYDCHHHHHHHYHEPHHSTPDVMKQDITGYELCANDTSVTEEDVADGAKEYGIAQWCAGKLAVQQVVCCGKTSGKTLNTVIQDTVWSGVTLQNPIVKEPEDVLRVIYSYELGNSKTSVGTVTKHCDCK